MLETVGCRLILYSDFLKCPTLSACFLQQCDRPGSRRSKTARPINGADPRRVILTGEFCPLTGVRETTEAGTTVAPWGDARVLDPSILFLSLSPAVPGYLLRWWLSLRRMIGYRSFGWWRMSSGFGLISFTFLYAGCRPGLSRRLLWGMAIVMTTSSSGGGGGGGRDTKVFLK